MDATTLIMLAILTILLLILFFRRNKKVQRDLKIANGEPVTERELKEHIRLKAISDGTYKATNADKSAMVVMAVILYGLFGFMIANGTYFAWVGAILGALIGVIFGGIAVLIGNEAEKKGRTFAAFAGLSLIFSPIIMGIIVATVSPVSAGSSTSTPVIHDAAGEIRKLGELRDNGLITTEEFESKKKQLLDRI